MVTVLRVYTLYLTTSGITVSAFPEYDVLNNIIDIHMPFSFDTDERYYPAHLIKISEND